MPDKRFFRTALVATGLTLTAGSTAAQDAITWDDRLFHQQPLEDDLVLPMPCGGGMVFRPVTVRAEGPAGNLLADRSFLAGRADGSGDLVYVEYRRTAHIGGGFTDPTDDTARLFYIGKYEVTRDQYAAVMEETCPDPSFEGAFPAAGLSWFDAVDFTRRYSEWLLGDPPADLPTEDGIPGYIRLPTEAEWSFAARGGQAVPEASFSGDLFPTDGQSIDNFAWHAASDSCDGKVQVVGLKGANPLGLHDVIGNVREIVLEPFRMTVADRLHGQVGGFVTRGGDCRTRRELLRVSDREEHFYFDPENGGGATRPDLAGMRIVLAAPVETSLERVNRIREDWGELRNNAPDTGPAPEDAPQPEDLPPAPRLPELDVDLDPFDDPIGTIERLADELDNAEIADALRIAAAAFTTERQARQASDARGARTTITAAVQLMRLDLLQTNALRGVQDAQAACGDDMSCRDQFAQALEVRQRARDTTETVFLGLLERTVRDGRYDLLESQLASVQEAYRASGGPWFETFAERFVLLVAMRLSSDPPSGADVMRMVRQ